MNTTKYLAVFLLVLMIPVPVSPQESNTSTNAEWRALTQSMDAMHSSMMQVQQSGNGDADFVKLMMPHHQAAIEMAKAQLLYGKDLQMRRLAQEIITDQQSEIELMQLWLKQQHTEKGAQK